MADDTSVTAQVSNDPLVQALQAQVQALRNEVDWLKLMVANGPPMRLHTREATKMLILGVAAVYGTEVAGEIAEFGTMTGSTAEGLAWSIAMADAEFAAALKLFKLPPKQLHLFDSFQGLPQVDAGVDAQSPHVQSGAWAAGTCRGLTKEQLAGVVARHLAPGRVRVFDGWFKDTLRTVPPGTKYALIHIDSDLYSSAIDVLDHLFSSRMVAEGAQLFFDDWNCNRASPEMGERRAWDEMVAKYKVRYSDEGAYAMVSHKFIVHSYG